MAAPSLQATSVVDAEGARQQAIIERMRSRALLHPLWTVLVLALAARWATSLAVFFTAGGTLFVDDITYPAMASAVVEGRTESWDDYTRWLYNATATYTLPLTLLYRVFGPTQLLAMLFTGLLGAAVAVLATRLCLETLPRHLALAVGAVLAVLPSQVLFSALTLKDASVWLLMSAAAVLVALGGRSAGRALVVPLAGLACVLLLLGHVRVHTMVIVAWAALLAALVAGRTGWWQRTIAVGSFLVVLPLALGLGPAGLSLIASSQENLEYRRVANAIGAATAFVELRTPDAAELESKQAAARRLGAVQRNAAASAAAAAALAQGLEAEVVRLRADAAAAQEASRTAEPQQAARLAADAAAKRVKAERLVAQARQQAAEAARLQAQGAALAAQAAEAARAAEVATAAASGSLVAGADGGSTTRDLRHLPKGLVVMLLAPLPWQVDGNRNVQFAALETLVWYPLLALALVGLTMLRRHRRVLAFPLLVTGAVALMYGLAEGNFGSAYRHRGELVWAVVVLAGHGTAVLVARRRARSSAI